MSRIGKLPITIPNGVEVNCSETKVSVKGDTEDTRSFVQWHELV